MSPAGLLGAAAGRMAAGRLLCGGGGSRLRGRSGERRCYYVPHQTWRKASMQPGPDNQARSFGCENIGKIPNEALLKQLEETQPPNSAQLRMLFLASALPFVGFGFLDNFLMIVCGELIDTSLCVMFTLSTMAAAAIGNTISDVAGIFSGGLVEDLARRAGVEEPPLEKAQERLRVTRVWKYTGQCLGIITGCFFGCCPLLWMDPYQGERLKKEKERNEVFSSVILKVQEILDAEAVALMSVDEESAELRSTHTSPNLRSFVWQVGVGFIGHVAETGRFVNTVDVQDEPLYNPELHDDFLGMGIKVESILCMPIFREGRVTGVIVVVNKRGSTRVFGHKDEDILSAICSHISVVSSDSKHTFDEVIENCEKSMRMAGSPEWNVSGASQRMLLLYEPALEGITNVLGAEATALMLLDSTHQELYTEVIDGPLQHHRTPVGMGIAGEAVATGKLINACISDKHGLIDPMRHQNYEGSGVDIRSELVVPLFDTSRKCLGAIKCINKHGSNGFSKEDVLYVKEAAKYIGMMLEGPDAGLRRVLALSRNRMQQRELIGGTGRHQCAVLCKLERAQNLPSRAEMKLIDPYVTFSIVRGNPLEDHRPDAAQRLLRARNKDRKEAIRRFAKSNTVLGDENARWNEMIAVGRPPKFADVPTEELFVHVLLWDYDALSPDEVVGQAAVPLAGLPEEMGKVKPVELLPLEGREGLYENLEHARLWVSFSIVGQQ